MGSADADIPASFFPDAIRGARNVLHMSGHELDLLRPLMNESGLSYKAHNSTGDAAGIFQAMPQTLKNLGFVGGWQAFTALDADGQLPWLFKYYAPYAGRLVNATAVYMATFCPAWLSHASEPGFVICASSGRSDGGLSASTSKLWYTQNRGLDKNGDGTITVSDLTAATLAADAGARWTAVQTDFTAALATLDGTPVVHTVKDCQTRLNAVLHDVTPLVVDGLVGPMTMHATGLFQTAAGLPATGHFDQATIAALFA